MDLDQKENMDTVMHTITATDTDITTATTIITDMVMSINLKKIK